MSFGSASCELALLAATAPELLVVVVMVVVVMAVVPAAGGSPRVSILRRRVRAGGREGRVSLCRAERSVDPGNFRHLTLSGMEGFCAHMLSRPALCSTDHVCGE